MQQVARTELPKKLQDLATFLNSCPSERLKIGLSAEMNRLNVGIDSQITADLLGRMRMGVYAHARETVDALVLLVTPNDPVKNPGESQLRFIEELQAQLFNKKPLDFEAAYSKAIY